MASSGYYYNQYRSYTNQVKSLKNKKSELEKITKEFTKNPVQGDPKDYNKKMKKALDAHSEALSGDNAFNSLYSALEEKKEKEVLEDSSLSAAYKAIVREISSLNKQIDDAQRKADQNWRNYQSAKHQEKIDADNKDVRNGAW